MLFLVKYRYFIAIAVLLAALVASGAYIKILQSDKKVLVAEKEQFSQALDVANGSITRLTTAVDEQNKAIDKLQLDAEERAKLSQVEVAKAKLVADSYKKKAQDLLGRTIPQGKNTCDAANDLFNEEIRKNVK